VQVLRLVSAGLYPDLISFCRISMKTCSPLLRSVSSSSRVSSHLSGWRYISFNSCSRARRGCIAWAHPIFLLPLSLSSVPYMRSGSVSCDSRTREGKVRWMASRGVGYPVVVSWPPVSTINVSPPSVRIVTSVHPADTSMALAHFHPFSYRTWTRCWVVIIACARLIFAMRLSSPD